MSEACINILAFMTNFPVCYGHIKQSEKKNIANATSLMTLRKYYL